MSRPRHQIALRLSPQELARIDRAARKRSLSRNAWLRRLFAETAEAELMEAEERRQVGRDIRNNVLFVRELLVAMLIEDDQEDMVGRVRDKVRNHLRESLAYQENSDDEDHEDGGGRPDWRTRAGTRVAGRRAGPKRALRRARATGKKGQHTKSPSARLRQRRRPLSAERSSPERAGTT